MDFPLCANIGKWEKCGELCGHTHTQSTSPEQLLPLLRGCAVRVDIYCSVYVPSVCVFLCVHACMSFVHEDMWCVCVCVCVCVAACVGQLCGRRIPLWPYPRFIDSHGVIWLRVNAWLSALYVQLQRGSRTTLFVLSCWISPQIKGCFTSFNRMNNKTQ